MRLRFPASLRPMIEIERDVILSIVARLRP